MSILVPLFLRLQRGIDWGALNPSVQCVFGELYRLDGSMTDPGVKLCDTLELPYRNDITDISSIRPGTYQGAVRSDGHLGWRIELNVPTRRNIQIHPGNTTDDTTGCILVGDRSSQPCFVGNSQKRRNEIKAIYGDIGNREVVIKISN
jgi:hypothetical protein